MKNIQPRSRQPSRVRERRSRESNGRIIYFPTRSVSVFVFDPRDFMEDPGLIHSALGHKEMEGRMKVHPGSEGLNGRDNPGPKLAPGDYLEVTAHRPEGAAAELTLKPAVVFKEDAQHLRNGEEALAVGDLQE